MASRGAAMGLLAAALFGVSAPISKRLLGDVSPQVLAGLLYLGAGLALTLYRALRPATTEAPLVKADLPKLAAVVAAGGVAGPVLMLFGLQRTSAVTSSLLLNLEAPFTIALAVLVFREHLGRYAAGAMALILAGAAILRLQPGAHRADTPGVLLLAGACAAWALDNNLTQRLSLRDPFALVRVKTLAAGSFNLALGLLIAGRMPSPRVTMAALALGSVSYGASVVLDAYALRLVGAAREAAYFATAPFLGALAAIFLTNERPGWSDGLAMAVMAAGVALLLRERHGHGHAHEALDHAHAHVHDEHHQHAHGPDDPSGEPHAHTHHHAPLAHDHAHTPDAHHRHRH
ncbi:MAG: EamA family transporter [Deltaproteobacteria bacterium]|nr:EamA family transporter [Deltaproteobacteria bacterium]